METTSVTYNSPVLEQHCWLECLQVGQAAWLQNLESLLRNLQVLPLRLCQLGCVLTPLRSCGILVGNVVSLCTLRLQKPADALAIDGHEVRVVGAQVHRSIRVLNRESGRQNL